MYEIDAKPGQENGVSFRSRLEREWWKKLKQQNDYAEAQGFKVPHFEYVDYSWFDFCVDGFAVELKPIGLEYLIQAVSRFREAGIAGYKNCKILHEGNPTLMIVQGEPDTHGPNRPGVWTIAVMNEQKEAEILVSESQNMGLIDARMISANCGHAQRNAFKPSPTIGFINWKINWAVSKG